MSLTNLCSLRSWKKGKYDSFNYPYIAHHVAEKMKKDGRAINSARFVCWPPLCVPKPHFCFPGVHDNRIPSHCRAFLEASVLEPCRGSDRNKLGWLCRLQVKTLLNFEFGEIKTPKESEPCVAANLKAHWCKSQQKFKFSNVAPWKEFEPTTFHSSVCPLTTSLFAPELRYEGVLPVWY